jgi:GNAT superfamily N-acetyltransferase
MEQDDALSRALADPSRRLLLDRLYERGGQTLRTHAADVLLALQAFMEKPTMETDRRPRTAPTPLADNQRVAASSLEIRPLTAETWDALAALFSQGGDPKWCWCTYWRVPGSSWSTATPDGNGRLLRRLTDASGVTPGLVALRDGEAVGWISLGPREDYERLERSRTIPQLPGGEVWSIVCFVVGRRARRTGVARALLKAAVDHARASGAKVLEAYPVRTGGQRIASASAYTGTLGMFERAGFKVASETTSKAGGGLPRVVVRRALRRRTGPRDRRTTLTATSSAGH